MTYSTLNSECLFTLQLSKQKTETRLSWNIHSKMSHAKKVALSFFVLYLRPLLLVWNKVDEVGKKLTLFFTVQITSHLYCEEKISMFFFKSTQRFWSLYWAVNNFENLFTKRVYVKSLQFVWFLTHECLYINAPKPEHERKKSVVGTKVYWTREN